jgi:hypothetical protein
LPIVVATGKGSEDVREIIRGVGNITFVGKPYRAGDLYGALGELGVSVKKVSS